MEEADDRLEFDMDYLTPTMKERARLELNETEENKIKALYEFRNLISKEKKLVCPTDDAFLLMFLRARKFDVNRSFKLLQNFFIWRKTKTFITDHCDPKQMKELLFKNFIGPLPYRDLDGCAILIFRVDQWNPDIYSLNDIIRITMAILYLTVLYPASQVTGYRVIFDCRELKWVHVKQFTPASAWLIVHAIQYCFPARYRGFHVLTENKLYKLIWTLMSSVLSKKLRSRVTFHGGDVKPLLDYIDPSVLPNEFGGDAGPINMKSIEKTIDDRTEEMLNMLTYGYKD